MITLGHYLKPYSKRIALGTVIKIVGTITELFLPWILSYMIDEVAPEKNVARIFLWGAVMLACAVVGKHNGKPHGVKGGARHNGKYAFRFV